MDTMSISEKFGKTQGTNRHQGQGPGVLFAGRT